MCGIFGMVLFENHDSDFFKIKTIVRRLALESKIRGRAATGMSIASKTGVSVLKYNTSSDNFIKMPEFRSFFNDQLPRKRELGVPYSIIGHTRHPTKGTEKVRANNHPIETGSIVGVHNGMIANDDELFRNLKDHKGDYVKRIGEVDSEIIFRLVEINSSSYKDDNLKTGNNSRVYNPTSLSIANASSKLTGSYACALQDADNPKMLWLFRNTSPIAAHYYPSSDVLIFASTESFIKSSVHNIDLGEPEVLSIDSDTCMCVNIKKRKYNTINLTPHKNQYTSRPIGYMG